MIVGYSILPLEIMIATMILLLVAEPILFSLKIIPRIDPKTGRREWVKLGRILFTPWNLVFDIDISEVSKRTNPLFQLTAVFVFTYVRLLF